MAKHRPEIALTPVQEAEAERLAQAFLSAAQDDIRQLARLMASKADDELFGQTEYEVRDLVLGIGAKALEISANERSKKGVLR